jgi:hypothetical protein
MKTFLALLVLFALALPAVACQPMQMFAPQDQAYQQAPMYMPYAPVMRQYAAPQYAMPSVFLQQPPSFTIINNNNNNNSGGSGVAAARAARGASLGTQFVPTAGTQVNFIGRRAFRFSRGVTINP